MEINKLNESIIEKTEFYYSKNIKCHVITLPKGTFKNGIFVSRLEQDTFFWFIPIETSIPIRIFLNEIFDVEDYKGRDIKEVGE